jgi:DNA-binding Xre family transcriptional regulator
MLKLNVSSLLRSRGIENAGRYLVQQGLAYHTANRLLTGKVESMTYETLEKLCLVCNCSPDELFVWVKDEGTTVAEDHPLQKLKPKVAMPSPVERIKKMSPAKLKKLQEFMDGLEKV